MSNRRQFIKNSTVAISLPLAIGFSEDFRRPKAIKKVFVHQVYIWLKNPDNRKDLQQLIEGIHTLRAIPSLKSYHIGLPAGTERSVVDGSYHLSWLTIFKDKAGHDAYQVHPIHQAFVEKYSHLWRKVLVYDSVDI